MFKEAVRLEYLNKSPAVSIVQLRENPKEKDILNINEVKALFQNDNIIPVWGNNILHYTINLLAASTGMRMEEVQALQIQ